MDIATNQSCEIDPLMFRAYDIRGVVGKNLNEAVAFQIGLAYGSEAIQQGMSQVVVARDGRLSGPKLLNSLKKGLMQTGLHVIDIGQVPTPLLYFACEYFKTNSGIMITGSHNPADYNGFKMVLNELPLAEESIQALYQRIVAQDFHSGEGRQESQSIVTPYIQAVTDRIQLSRTFKVVVDCGNGVVGMMAKEFFNALGCDCETLFCDVDGRFPNHHPDPGQPKNLRDLQEKVLSCKADVGFAFDGDGDRLGIVTNRGEIIWPDTLMMLYVKAILEKEPGKPIIYDVKCSHHLGEFIRAHGGEPVMYKTGHSLIKRHMKKCQAPFAGEMSGHFFFKHRWYGFDDALFSAAMLLERIDEDSQHRPLSALTAELPTAVSTPEINIPVSEVDKFHIISQLIGHSAFQDGELITVDGLRVAFEHGWGLVRASNTTPNLVLRFEGDTKEALQAIQQRFKQALKETANLDCPF